MAEGENFDSAKLMNIGPLHDLEGYEECLPHQVWPELIKWNEDKKQFYFDMLQEATSYSCRCGLVGSKHIMGQDQYECLVEMRTKRHDWVLAEISNKMRQAMIEAKEGSFLYSSADWKFLERFWSKNVSYDWPEELFFMRGCGKPHILAYSPEGKKAVIVEIKVTWEHWLKLQNHEQRYEKKFQKYRATVEKLEINGFQVKFKYIELGCRGVYCQELEKLFREEFKMESEEISDTLKAITKKLISFPYKEYKTSICIKENNLYY